MTILDEGKRLDFEYNKDWTDIPRDIFDQIIAIDPVTNIDQDKIGPSCKQLLLPRYLEGENFLEKADAVKDALKTYLANRGSYPQVLRNIANFPSVEDFVDYINNGENSAFAKRFDLNADNTVKKAETKNPIDTLYDKYYSDIDRDLFNKLIALDPKTSDKSIGEVAKNLLLPAAKRKDPGLDNKELSTAIDIWYETKDTLAGDKKDISKYTSLNDFITYMIAGPDSSFKKELKEKVPADQINFLASTPSYDIIQPLTWEANTAIVQKPTPESPTTSAALSWCTGYGTTPYYWNNYTANGGLIICFINKRDPKYKPINYQLNISRDGRTILEFLNGEDRNPLGSSRKNDFFKSVLLKDPSIFYAIENLPMFVNNPVINDVRELFKNGVEDFNYDTPEALQNLKSNELAALVKNVTVSVPIVAADAFEGFNNIREVIFKPTVEKIQPQAFFNCTSLRHVQFNDGLKEISGEAFANCLSLKGSVFIPNSVERIGREAFRNTQVVLALDKARTTPIKFAAQDRDWLSRHVKAITVQPKPSNESLLESETINENIPRDLARAYQKSNKAVRGIQMNPDSEHEKIGSNAPRSRVKYDYANSSYEEISSAEAIELINRNFQNLEHLRLLIDGNLIEYELRDGKRPYQSYWAIIPWEVLTARDAHFVDTKGNETNDSRFITSKSAIKQLLSICDKIYKTDEYAHLITPQTKTRKGKIKVQTGVDENDQPIYEIVDDTIENRRKRNRAVTLYRSLLPRTHGYYSPHHPAVNFDSGHSGITVMDVMDTGAHDPTKWTRTSDYTRLHVDPSVDDQDISGGSYRILKGLSINYDKYLAALQQQKKLFKKFDYARRALKKLEQEQDLYDPEEYQTEHDKVGSYKESTYQDYLTAAEESRIAKSEVLTQADNITAKMSVNLRDMLKELDHYINGIYETEKALTQLRAKKLAATSSKIREYEERKNSLLQDVETYRKQKQKLLDQIAELQRGLEANELSIDTALKRIAEVQKAMENVSEEELDKKFKEIDSLTQTINKYQDELQTKFHRTRGQKKVTKEFNPDVANIISFDSDDTEGDSAQQ